MSYLDKTASLTPEAYEIICHHATELSYSGQYHEPVVLGSYLCRRCGLALFRANSQFSSGCGWPSFDLAIPTTIRQLPDPDGERTEIRCQRCDAHLGHLFIGEGYTRQNQRYCVNSLALDFVAHSEVKDSEEAIVAGGCFWGVDYYLQKIPGVLKTEVGYCGGQVLHPTYQQVCTGQTGHFEAVRIIYDRNKTDFKTIATRFFEIHDPTQTNGQGADLGPQYQSAVFYYDDYQHQLVNDLIAELRHNGYQIATQQHPIQTFWPAEEYHQHYYRRHAKTPVCHQPVKRFAR